MYYTLYTIYYILQGPATRRPHHCPNASWKPMPFYEHVHVYTLSYKLKFSRMAFASRPITRVGLSATGSQWHLILVETGLQRSTKLCPPRSAPSCAPSCAPSGAPSGAPSEPQNV